MAIEYTTQNYTTSKQILAIPDHYVNIAQKIEQNHSLAVDVDGRKILKAGTIFPSNDDKAQGVVFNDYDVTYGDVNIALLIHGFLRTDRLPVAPSEAAKKALPMVAFLPKSGE